MSGTKHVCIPIARSIKDDKHGDPPQQVAICGTCDAMIYREALQSGCWDADWKLHEEDKSDVVESVYNGAVQST